MTVQSGKAVDLTKIASEAKGKCCWKANEIGLGVVNGDTTIVRMDGSGGKFFVTNDANCGQPITASAYTTTFSYLYVCGQCKGGCPQVDGGKDLVQPYGSCVTASGGYDLSKKCIASHPVCMSGSGKCVTIAESSATPAPAPAPAATACASYSNLGQDCNTAQGKCCGGGKNAKCENGKCVTTYPTGR
jgi:hypothetical protein